jgi:predicted metal-binding transcription factor (methanogenesis marker protein 9)
MEAKEFMTLLQSYSACSDACEWAAGKTWEEVYTTCNRGDWLLWLFKKTNPTKVREITLAKGNCANLARQWMKDKRSTDAVDMAIRFGEGNATGEELAAAAADATYAAYAAADAYADADDADDADAAATDAAADAAYAAADAYASAAADAADAYADADARKESLQKSADICRKYLPIEIWEI